MAVNETYAERRDPIPPIDAGVYRRPLFPAIRWGAVLAGVFVGVSVQLVMTLLGIATGLASANLAAGEAMGIGPLLWAGLSMLVAAFVGGYVAARMSDKSKPGHVAVTKAVWEQVASRFEAEDLGDMEVKGKGTIAVFGIRPQKT